VIDIEDIIVFIASKHGLKLMGTIPTYQIGPPIGVTGLWNTNNFFGKTLWFSPLWSTKIAIGLTVSEEYPTRIYYNERIDQNRPISQFSRTMHVDLYDKNSIDTIDDYLSRELQWYRYDSNKKDDSFGIAEKLKCAIYVAHSIIANFLRKFY